MPKASERRGPADNLQAGRRGQSRSIEGSAWHLVIGIIGRLIRSHDTSTTVVKEWIPCAGHRSFARAKGYWLLAIGQGVSL